jgi:Holliday junction resolvasome RuvABC endonuclease subunit
MKAYIGIDPGSSSGAIAVICDEGTYVMEFSKATTKEWFDWLNSLATACDCTAVLEKVHGMPKMNVVAISSFMKNVGHIEMALIALGIPFKEVTPQTWMKYYGMKKEGTETKTAWKRRLREKLSRIMPSFKSTNDTADAMLIANYCKMHETTL